MPRKIEHTVTPKGGSFHIQPVTADHIDQLSVLLCEAVALGASVSFMHPLSMERAQDFWRTALDDVSRGGRIVLGAFENNKLVATASLMLDFPDNQPHRAEVGKLITAPFYRGRGLASLLMRSVEELAVERGKSLLVLDTAEDGGAAALYERLGYTRVGIIPDFALKPQGGLSATVLFWKRFKPPVRL